MPFVKTPDGGFSSELYEGLDALVLLPEIEVEVTLGEIYERVEFGARDSSRARV